MFHRLLSRETGVLTFEWILATSMLAIGLITGLAVVKSALSVEITDLGQAATGLNAGYDIQGLQYTTTRADNTGVSGGTADYAFTTYRSYASGDVNTSITVDGRAPVTPNP